MHALFYVTVTDGHFEMWFSVDPSGMIMRMADGSIIEEERDCILCWRKSSQRFYKHQSTFHHVSAIVDQLFFEQ